VYGCSRIRTILRISEQLICPRLQLRVLARLDRRAVRAARREPSYAV
jgi:hypothetical protein